MSGAVSTAGCAEFSGVVGVLVEAWRALSGVAVTAFPLGAWTLCGTRDVGEVWASADGASGMRADGTGCDVWVPATTIAGVDAGAGSVCGSTAGTMTGAAWGVGSTGDGVVFSVCAVQDGIDVGCGLSMEAAVFGVPGLAGLTSTGDAVSAGAASVCRPGAGAMAEAV